MAIPKPCLVCGALTTTGSRCPRHAVQRGSTADQARFRRAVLAKTGGRCARCGSARGVQAHHVRPLGEGGADDAETNGEPMCRRCHRQAHS